MLILGFYGWILDLMFLVRSIVMKIGIRFGVLQVRLCEMNEFKLNCRYGIYIQIQCWDLYLMRFVFNFMYIGCIVNFYGYIFKDVLVLYLGYGISISWKC